MHALILALALIGQGVETQPASEGLYARSVAHYPGSWSQVAPAIEEAPREVRSSVVRVRVGSSMGSGTYLGGGLVLTAAHVPAGESTSVASVSFPGHGTLPGKVVKADRQWDIAAVQLDHVPKGLAGVKLARRNPGQGDILTSGGYSSGRLVLRTGRFLRTATANGGGPGDWIEIGNPSYGGDSGGPVFNARGLLVGNLWGSARGTTTALNCGRVHRFLFPWNSRLAAWHAYYDGGGRGCAPGFNCAPSAGRPAPGASTPPTPVPPVNPPQDPPRDSRIDDIQKQLDEIRKLLSERPKQGEPGVAGPQGPKGPEGPQGKQGQLAQEDKTAIAAAIAEYLKADEEFRSTVKGKDGEDGTNGENGQDGTPAEPIDIDELAKKVAARLKAAGPAYFKLIPRNK